MIEEWMGGGILSLPTTKVRDLRMPFNESRERLSYGKREYVAPGGERKKKKKIRPVCQKNIPLMSQF